MKYSISYDCRHLLFFRHLLPIICVTVFVFSLSVFSSCKKAEVDRAATDQESLRQVLYVQSLYNNHPGEDIVPQIMDVIDSMRNAGRNPYYFAAVNVLIDRLFSDGRFSEADSLAVRMGKEALEDRDSLSMAMAKRVRAQMLYKLSQPEEAFKLLEPAGAYITNPYHSGSDFGTATSIQEWLWIIARDLGDTANMNKAGMSYANMVETNSALNDWNDATCHYPVSALAFKAEDSFSKRDMKSTKTLLDSANSKILPTLPSRAYEHFYAVRCKVRAADANWEGAIADVDTLLKTHKDFPWFYLKDLLLKAEILNMAGRHEESAKAYSNYIAFHDSLSNKITDKRLHDLTVLYRTEIDQEQKRADRFRMFAFGSVICLLLILLILALLNAAREKKRNRLLVERLKEFDRATETAYQIEPKEDSDEIPLIDRLDRYMFIECPYTNPALSRKELADFAGLTQDALGQLIKKEKGTSVRTYINSFRLEAARKALGSNSNEGIAEMAVRLGFGTARTLQRAFKERYDMSPTQYREASNDNKTSENQ
ncbi:MAG: helix-turn-helix transcriptional regulator [Muribaculaceae bacterium]|nr:helix-turn-helix transcriptional regulator [Muribaculaceae bacterium]